MSTKRFLSLHPLSQKNRSNKSDLEFDFAMCMEGIFVGINEGTKEEKNEEETWSEEVLREENEINIYEEMLKLIENNSKQYSKGSYEDSKGSNKSKPIPIPPNK
jgi:hypothetical protein